MRTRKTGKYMKLSAGMRMVIGVGVTLTITILSSVAMSLLISGDKMPESSIRILKNGIWMLSTVMGCAIGIEQADQRKLVKGAIITSGYLLFLAVISVAIEQGNFRGLIPAIICSSLGSAVVCVAKSRGKGISKCKRK